VITIQFFSFARYGLYHALLRVEVIFKTNSMVFSLHADTNVFPFRP